MLGFSATALGAAVPEGGAFAGPGVATEATRLATGAATAVIIALITASLAFACFRRTISSVLRSNACPLF